MSDILISYSRKNIQCVKKLCMGLRARKLDVWIDFEGIPPTVEWLAEIVGEIERADCVLIVISPDWVASEICSLELDHALRLNKRIIPVVIQETPMEQILEDVRRLNFIFTLTEETQKEAIELIIEALHTDYDVLRLHTQLLSRARQWESSGRNTSFLLRGQELSAADAWLTTNSQNPAPMAIHREHIVASQSHAQRRRRIFFGVITFVTLISIITAVFYFQELDRSEQRVRIARSREIASIALDRIGKAEDQALLLAMAAYEVHPTLESSDTLQRILIARPGLAQVSPILEGTVLALTFTRDASAILFGLEDGSVKRWKLGERFFDTLIESKGESASSMALTPAGTHIVTGHRDYQRVDWVQLDDRVARTLPTTKAHDLTAVTVSSDGTYVSAANGLRGQGVSLWGVEQPEKRRILATPDSFGAVAVRFSSSGKLLAVAGYDSQIAVYNVATTKLIATLDTVAGDGIYALDIDFNERWVAAGSGETVFLSDLKNPSLAPRELVWQNHGVRSVAFSPNGQRLAVGYANGFVGIWDLTDRLARPHHLIGLQKYVDRLAFDPSGRWLAAGGYDQRIALWDLARVSGFGQLIGVMDKKVTAIAISDNGHRVASGSEDAVTIWPTAPLSVPLATLSGPRTWVSSLAFTNEDEKIAAVSGRYLLNGRAWTGYMRWDISGVTPFAETPLPRKIPISPLEQMVKDFAVPRDHGFDPLPDLVLPTAMSTDGRSMSATDLPWAPNDLRPVILIDRIGQDAKHHSLQTDHARELQGLTFSPDGSLFASVSGDRVEVWLIQDQRRIRVFKTPDGLSCTDVTFLSDNSLAATCGESIWRFSAYAGEPHAIANPGNHLRLIVAGAVGTHLVTLDQDNALQLWDETTERPIGSRIPAGAPVISMSLHENGQRLVTGHADGTVVLWRFDPDYWHQLACRLAGRDLTSEEWVTYVKGEKPHELCP